MLIGPFLITTVYIDEMQEVTLIVTSGKIKRASAAQAERGAKGSPRSNMRDAECRARSSAKRRALRAMEARRAYKKCRK